MVKRLQTWAVSLVMSLAVSLALPGAAPPPASAQPASAQTGPAQTAPAPAASHQDEMLHFATEYTGTVMLGIAAGGFVMNTLIGGPAATLAGALIGSSLASWLFVDSHARDYVISHTTPHEHR